VKRQGSSKEVVVSDWDGENAQVVTSGGLNLLPSFTPSGDALLYTSYRGGRPQVYLHRLGGAPTLLVGGVMATGAVMSPDGKRLAYALAQGESTNIFVANADGSKPRQLTNTPFFINTSPAWSPDGNRLAFVSNRAGSPQIYVMGADGSNPKRLTFQGTYNQTPDWSPRGDLIAFTARDERNAFDLFTVNAETGKIVRLTQDQGNNEEPAFAPNGRLIVFTSNRKGAPALYVMTTDGKKQVELPGDHSFVTTPVWGP
jgi:TolB protein